MVAANLVFALAGMDKHKGSLNQQLGTTDHVAHLLMVTLHKTYATAPVYALLAGKVEARC